MDFVVDDKFKCSVSSYLPICQGVVMNTKPKSAITKQLGMQVVNINYLDHSNYLVYVGQYLDPQHPVAKNKIMDSKARIDIYSSSYNQQKLASAHKMNSSKREGSGQIATIEIPFAQFTNTTSTTGNISAGVPSLIDGENNKPMYWSAVCINGRTSLNDIHAINQLSDSRPDVSKVCKSELSPVMKKIN